MPIESKIKKIKKAQCPVNLMLNDEIENKFNLKKRKKNTSQSM